MVFTLVAPHIHHKRAHHVVGVRAATEIDRRGQGGAEAMYRSAVLRVEGAEAIKILRNCPHLQHAFTVIGGQALDFGAAGFRVSSHVVCFDSTRSSSIIPVLEPHLNLPGTEARNLAREAFAVRSIGMWLLRKLAHEKTGLLMRKSRKRVSSTGP